jgi:hypothetical protein
VYGDVPTEYPPSPFSNWVEAGLVSRNNQLGFYVTYTEQGVIHPSSYWWNATYGTGYTFNITEENGHYKIWDVYVNGGHLWDHTFANAWYPDFAASETEGWNLVTGPCGLTAAEWQGLQWVNDTGSWFYWANCTWYGYSTWTLTGVAFDHGYDAIIKEPTIGMKTRNGFHNDFYQPSVNVSNLNPYFKIQLWNDTSNNDGEQNVVVTKMSDQKSAEHVTFSSNPYPETPEGKYDTPV